MNRITIVEFESRLKEYVERARLGHEFTLLDGKEPVACLMPIRLAEVLLVREPLERSSSLQDVPMPPPIDLGFDVVDLLLDDRRVDR